VYCGKVAGLTVFKAKEHLIDENTQMTLIRPTYVAVCLLTLLFSIRIGITI